MAILRTDPEDAFGAKFTLATQVPRLRWPLVIAVLLAYLTVAALQSAQFVYLLLLFPVALLALDFAYELTDRLKDR